VQLQKLGVFEVVNGLPNRWKTVGSCIIFHEKQDRHGNLVKFKAYIVAKDFLQIPKENFIDTFLFVPKFSTLRIFLAYIVYLNWDLYHIDIIVTYLHGPLNEEIYITIPDSIEHFRSGRYQKLKKAFYKLKQARR